MEGQNLPVRSLWTGKKAVFCYVNLQVYNFVKDGDKTMQNVSLEGFSRPCPLCSYVPDVYIAINVKDLKFLEQKFFLKDVGYTFHSLQGLNSNAELGSASFYFASLILFPVLLSCWTQNTMSLQSFSIRLSVSTRKDNVLIV